MKNIKKLILGEQPTAPEDKLLEALANDVLDGLNVDLVSIWFFDDLNTSIKCSYSIDKFNKRDLRGVILKRKDFPNYFTAIIEGVSIRASDVTQDIQTKELIDAYLKPNGILSLLDYVIYEGEKAVGLICCETTSEYRKWTDKDVDYVRILTVLAGVELKNAKKN